MKRNARKLLSMVLMVALLAVSLGVSAVAESTQPLSGQLVVAAWGGDPFESAWQDKFAEFTEQTGVEVILDVTPWENLKEKSALALASGTGAYDVLYVHPLWFNEFAKNGYLAPVSDYASQEEVDQFVPDLLNTYYEDGVLYGLPDFITTQVLAYRTDLFEAAGLAAPQSWDDVLAAAEKLYDGDNMAGITFPGKKGGTLASIFCAVLVSNGGWYYDEEGKPSVNTPELIEAIDFLAQVSKYAPNGFLNYQWDENGTTASAGKAAMALCMAVNSQWLDDPERSPTAGNWAYVPITSNKGTAGGVIDSYCWSVAKDSQNSVAAGELVKFIAGTDAQKYFTQTSGTSGATKAYYEDEALLNSTPVLAAMNEIFKTSKPYPSWSTWAAQQETLEAGIQNVIAGSTTSAEVAAALQAQMEAE